MTATPTGLLIGPELTLPEDAVTETFAILAKRGKGKTSTAVVMAEEMIRARLPVVIIDPVGVWWGLRSSADGASPGLPVVIFGGDHADVPLEETAGKLLADLVVDERLPAVIDLSVLSKSASRRFMTEFIERLYHRNREPLHVIVDEADAFAPQRAHADGARLLGAMEDLVRRGRARGIGVTLITQRPAVLNKDVLTQAEVLIVLGMTGPRDVAAIDEWVRLHADEDEARAVKASLPSLAVGTAWVWSPGWLNTLVQVHVRRRDTFDSSATPKAGQKRPAPKRMADVDIAALGEKIAATLERVKSDDPRLMRARISELERDLTAERAKPATVTVERVGVPVLDESLIDQIEAALGPAVGLLGEVQETLAKHRYWLDHQVRAAPTVVPATQQPSHMSSNAPRPPAPRREVSRPGALPLPKAHRAVLTVLAQHGPRSRVQTAVLAGYAHNGGGYSNALSALRTAGQIDGRDPLTITDAGVQALGPYDPLPTGPALLAHWQARLGRAERLILEHLTSVWPSVVGKDEVAVATGYAAGGGGFNNALSKLRSLELIEGRAALTAADALCAQ